MKKISIITAIFVLSIFLVPMLASAQEVKFPADNTTKQPLLGTNLNPTNIIGNVIKGVLGVIGTVALGLFVYGGIEIMISRGDSAKIKKGYDTMIYAAIGLAVIFASYALTSYIITAVSK